MDKETARAVLALMFEYGGKLNDAMLTIRENADDEEFARYRRGIGQVLDSAFEQIINPILDEYPELRPQALNPDADEPDP
jgi:hypothetical protein